MAPTLAAVLDFIHFETIWKPLKKFLAKDSIILFDSPFKLSTKYTPALLIVMICLSFANQLIRSVEMDCVTGEWNSNGGKNLFLGESNLNDYCWNYDTFLVAKALEPKMRGEVAYPGISTYIKGSDELIRQRYYKQLWLVLGILSVLSFLPLFIWKLRGKNKLKSLIEIQEGNEAMEDRINYFLETVGFNKGFGNHYFGCKLLSTITPFVQWYFLCGFIGRRYKSYGLDVLYNFMDDTDPWPNPMDALFPKMAKCEWAKYGYGGDIELKSAQCQLPMNNLSQWSFFIYWWWLVVVFGVSCLSLIQLILTSLPPYRRYKYKSYVARVCREEIERGRSDRQSGNKKIKNVSKSAIVKVNLSFGDWLLLDLLKKNLGDWQFREFIRKMVMTQNRVFKLQFQRNENLPICLASGKLTDNSIYEDESGAAGGDGYTGSIQQLEAILENGPNQFTSTTPKQAGWIIPPNTVSQTPTAPSDESVT